MLVGLVASLLFSSTPAHAAVIKPTGWSASSSAPNSDGVSYDVKNLGDARQSTPWIEGDEGSGLGSWAQADFGAERSISAFTVWGGCWYTFEYWGRYNRPNRLVLEFSDGTTQEFALADEFKPQTFQLSGPKKTSFVKVRVKGVYAGNTFNDTALSEILFRDTEKDLGVPVRDYAASTTFPADGDGNYEAVNTTDGILDSMWCEGNTKTDGTSEWIEFGFAGPTSVSRFVLRNGNAYSFPYFMKSNRATAATLTFSDGTAETIAVKDSISEQTISFAPRSTGKVRVTFTGVKKGQEFNDLCLSEAYFLP